MSRIDLLAVPIIMGFKFVYAVSYGVDIVTDRPQLAVYCYFYKTIVVDTYSYIITHIVESHTHVRYMTLSFGRLDVARDFNLVCIEESQYQ